EPAVRSMAARVLRRSGYAVLEASNGEEALRVAAKSGPGSIQLVLTDIVMPQMDGKAFSEEFTRLNPGVAVLFMSGYIEESMLRKQALDPDRNFLQKPFTPAALSARVRLLLAGN
ncbi:MAG: response regulator, partial [Elusimicrobiota bacterium]